MYSKDYVAACNSHKTLSGFPIPTLKKTIEIDPMATGQTFIIFFLL